MLMHVNAKDVMVGMWIDGRQVIKVHRHKRPTVSYSFQYDDGYDNYRYEPFVRIMVEWRDSELGA